MEPAHGQTEGLADGLQRVRQLAKAHVSDAERIHDRELRFDRDRWRSVELRSGGDDWRSVELRSGMDHRQSVELRLRRERPSDRGDRQERERRSGRERESAREPKSHKERESMREPKSHGGRGSERERWLERDRRSQRVRRAEMEQGSDKERRSERDQRSTGEGQSEHGRTRRQQRQINQEIPTDPEQQTDHHQRRHRERPSERERSLDRSRERPSEQERSLDRSREGPSERERSLDCSRDRPSGRERSLDCSRDRPSGRERSLDRSREGRSSRVRQSDRDRPSQREPRSELSRQSGAERRRSSAPSQPSPRPPHAAAQTPLACQKSRCEDVFLRGWVFKREGFKRLSVFARLRKGILEFRDKAFDAWLLDTIDVRSCKFSFNERKRCIYLQAAHDQRSPLSCFQPEKRTRVCFSTDSNEEMEKWLTAISAVATWDAKSNYEFRDEIGKGKYGVVWLAVDKRDGQEVALKAVNKKRALKKYVAREKMISSVVDNEHLVRCIDVFESVDDVYLVQEYAKGGTLSEFLRDRSHNRVSEWEARTIVSHILEALVYLHANNIVHRDIKPENIVMAVNDDGEITPKLCDFGLSTFDDTVRRLRSMVGSPHYVAPEVVLSRSYDRAVDLWSCGVLLFVLSTGHFPFEVLDNADLRRVLRAFSVEQITDWGNTSTKCRALVSRLLVREPKERATAAEALADPWFSNS